MTAALFVAAALVVNLCPIEAGSVEWFIYYVLIALGGGLLALRG